MITDDEIREHVAANVLRLIEEREWSQRDLAEKAGESPMNINRVCRGENVVRVGIVARIAEALGVNVDRLIAEPPSPVVRKARQSA